MVVGGFRHPTFVGWCEIGRGDRVGAINHRMPMKRSCLILMFSLFAVASFAEEAPQAINAHFEWCGEPKKMAEKLKRYEGFWKDRHPEEEDGYEDSPHVTYVRLCGYRLAALYAQTGQKEKCLKMLQWLEKNDDSFPGKAE